MTTFNALRVLKKGNSITREIEHCNISHLPENEVLIKVLYSSLNYKDALSASGHAGITRSYPHTPGIDAAGIIVSDKTGKFKEGDEVSVTGFDLGMNTWGGFSEFINVPAAWVVKLPEGLSVADAMRIGTAGITAAYCVEKLIKNGLTGKGSNVLVTGASGGVGSIAVHLLSTLGFQVTASSGKPDQTQWLKNLGAKDVIDRESLSKRNNKALLPEKNDGVIDTVGGDTLVNAVKQLKYGGSAACCGIVGGTAVPADIFPFILRGVNILGIASADASLHSRKTVLAKFVTLWHLPLLEKMCDEISLNQLSDRIDLMLAGKIIRRALIRMES